MSRHTFNRLFLGFLVTATVVTCVMIGASSSHAAYTARLTAGVTQSEVKKGEGFTYTLTVVEEGSTDNVTELTPPDFGPFAVSGTSRVSQVSVARDKARKETTLRYTLSTDKPGEHTIPPASLTLRDVQTAKEQVMTSNVVKVTVADETPGIMDDIKDIREPKSFLDHVRRMFYMAALLVAILIISLVALVVYMARRNRDKAPPLQAARTVSHREALLRALEGSERLTGDPREFYTGVTDALRSYLKAAHGIPATEATTSELIGSARKKGLPDGAVRDIEALFNEADLVKFAKHFPDENEMRAYLDRTKALARTL